MDLQRPSPGRACTLQVYTQDRFDPEIEALRRSDFHPLGKPGLGAQSL